MTYLTCCPTTPVQIPNVYIFSFYKITPSLGLLSLMLLFFHIENFHLVVATFSIKIFILFTGQVPPSKLPHLVVHDFFPFFHLLETCLKAVFVDTETQFTDEKFQKV